MRSKSPCLFKTPYSLRYLGLFKTRASKGLCAFGLVLATLSQISPYAKLIYSPTPSLPYRLFLSLNQVKPKKGQYTCIDNPWYGGRVIKKVMAGAGDTLLYDSQGGLWIERRSSSPFSPSVCIKVGIPQKMSKEGRLLTPIQPGVIPEGKVFLAGEHERSFDSRYEEVGLVFESDLQGCLLALA